MYGQKQTSIMHTPAHTNTHTHNKYMTPFKILWRELLTYALSLLKNIVGIFQSHFLVNPYAKSQTFKTHSNTIP